MKTLRLAGSTDVSDIIVIRDKADNTPLTGIAFGDVTAYYSKIGSTPVEIPVVTQTVTGAHTDGGFVEIDAVNMPGHYRVDHPDDMFTVGSDSVFFQLKGHTDMNPVDVEIELTTFEVSDTTSNDRLVNIDEATGPSEISEYIDANSTKLDVAVSTRSSHTASDVATAVWNFIVENGKTAKAHLNRIKAILGGNTQTGGTEFMDDAGTTVETTVTVDESSNRTFS